MHLLPIAVPIWIGVLVIARDTDRVHGGGTFVFAWATHLVGDSYRAFLGPDPHIPSDLLWPLRPPIRRPIEPGLAGPNSIYVKLWTVFSIVVLGLALYFLAREFSSELGEMW